MARVLVTGMSGTGKTTLLQELARRGLRTVDTDYDGWTLSDGSWDAARMAALLDEHSDVVVSGAVDNQVDFLRQVRRRGAAQRAAGGGNRARGLSY